VQFKEEFQTVNSKSPDTNHIFYYLCLWTAINAIKLAGTAEDTEAIALAARSGNLEWDTPVGRAHFTPDGDSGLSGMSYRSRKAAKPFPLISRTLVTKKPD